MFQKRYPDAPDAEFPQHEEVIPLDFRAEALPASAYVHRFGRRKFTDEEKARIQLEKERIPEKEAKRLGLLEDTQDYHVGADELDKQEVNEADLAPNVLSGAIINGVKRHIVKPVLNRKRNGRQAGKNNAQPPQRKRVVVSGSKKTADSYRKKEDKKKDAIKKLQKKK